MQLQLIQSRIYDMRGLKVMFDFDLANLYKVENRALKQAVKRNIERFPDDFMFQLNKSEWQEVITNCDNLPEGVKFSPVPPFAFTEQGVAMLSGLLKSREAIEINIAIMRTFVYIREYALTHQELTQKLNELESKYDQQHKDAFDAINFLIQKDLQNVAQNQRNRIGY